MTPQFSAVIRPPADLIWKIASLNPRNPFYTPCYSNARDSLGEVPCVLALRTGGNIVAGCTAFLRGNFLTRTLEISSLPTVVEAETFWDGLIEFCRKHGVWDLYVESFASENSNIPILAPQIGRRYRYEYVLDLNDDNPSKQLSTQHRRNLSRARKADLHVRRTRAVEACASHVELVNVSMGRRMDRGEDVSPLRDSVVAQAVLSTGAGEIFQTFKEDKILSSILVLRSDQGGYYHSAGTSPEGMELGASPFLICEVARILKDEGTKIFNLGGAEPDNPGLQRFKRGFGAREIMLEAASFSMVSAVKRKVRTGLKVLRHDPAGLAKSLVSVERFVVYSAPPEAIEHPIEYPNVKFEKLTDEALLLLSTSADYHGQAERFGRLKFNDAYGLFFDNELVHVAWLVSAVHDRSLVVRNVRLQTGEAEITHCETKSEFRGRGFYSLAIKYLCRIAARENVRHVYMITGTQNIASQRGIEKTGFPRRGFITRVICPVLTSRVSIVFRGHRWFIRVRGNPGL